MKTPPGPEVPSHEEIPCARRMAHAKPSAIREILKMTESPDIISFAGGLPAPELFPVEKVKVAAETVLSTQGATALQYSVTEGYMPLREWVSSHLHATVKLQAPAARVLITHGSQQALDLIAKVLLDPGDTVLVEDPAYLGALQVFRTYEARVVGLPSDDEGLSVPALEEKLLSLPQPPKFLYLIPNFQNPTGTSLQARRRLEIAALAERHRLLVIEDDPYGELRYSGEPPPAACASLNSTRWVYLGTASKILTPGLRVAWCACGDRRLFERLVMAKQAADLHTSTFNQRIVHELVRDASWLRGHLRTLCKTYGARRDVMIEALQRELGSGCTHTRPEGGLFLWLTLPPALDTLEVLHRSMEQRVAFVPGHPFWVDGSRHNTLRLNFSNASEQHIREGVQRLAGVLRA